MDDRLVKEVPYVQSVQGRKCSFEHKSRTNRLCPLDQVLGRIDLQSEGATTHRKLLDLLASLRWVSLSLQVKIEKVWRLAYNEKAQPSPTCCLTNKTGKHIHFSCWKSTLIVGCVVCTCGALFALSYMKSFKNSQIVRWSNGLAACKQLKMAGVPASSRSKLFSDCCRILELLRR